jgi:hypothetical protein
MVVGLVAAALLVVVSIYMIFRNPGRRANASKWGADRRQGAGQVLGKVGHSVWKGSGVAATAARGQYDAMITSANSNKVRRSADEERTRKHGATIAQGPRNNPGESMFSRFRGGVAAAAKSAENAAAGIKNKGQFIPVPEPTDPTLMAWSGGALKGGRNLTPSPQVAVTADGEMYELDLDGEMYELDRSGAVVS